MNYNSVDEILASGIANMTAIRDGVKQDDGTDTMTGVDWFTFNGTIASTIYASGNSWIGFGSSSEDLKVNRRDGAMHSLYREEGTLYGYYKFLKIRWLGYSHYGNTASTHALTYDVILWDTGDISLHMISIPTSYNDGTYSLIASSTYSYTVSATEPDITFIKNDSGFEVSNSIITLKLPYEMRYLIRSENTYYTVSEGSLSEIAVSELTSSVFLDSGVNDIPDISLLSTLSNPEILYWHEIDDVLGEGLVINGAPTLPQIVYYESQDITGYSSIGQAEVVASDDVTFAITFDGGQTWKYYDGNVWNTAETESDGMSAKTIKNISSSVWAEITTSKVLSFRCALPSLTSTASGIYIRYV